MTNSKELSTKRVNWIREQGYFSYSDQQIRDLAFGNRFAYRLCLTFLVPGVVFANIPLLIIVNIVALLSIFLPNHPFDYIYNDLMWKWMKKPQVPRRSIQLKFACTLATIFIASTIYFMSSGMMTAGYLMGGQIIAVASLVSFTDLCIPSKVFNFFAGKLGYSKA